MYFSWQMGLKNIGFLTMRVGYILGLQCAF